MSRRASFPGVRPIPDVKPGGPIRQNLSDQGGNRPGQKAPREAKGNKGPAFARCTGILTSVAFSEWGQGRI